MLQLGQSFTRQEIYEIQLRARLEKLDSRSRDIIQARYLEANRSTLKQLATKYEISIERVRQLELKAWETLND